MLRKNFYLLVFMFLMLSSNVYGSGSFQYGCTHTPVDVCLASVDVAGKDEENLSRAREAFYNRYYDAAIKYAEITISLYQKKAQEIQGSLTEYAWESKEKVLSYGALNAVAVAYGIIGNSYIALGEKDKAEVAFQKVSKDFFYGQCWDERGWFCKPAEQVQEIFKAKYGVELK